MQCTHCGHDNRVQARFCTACGTALAHPGQGDLAPPTTPRPSRRGLIPGTLALALLLATGFGVWLLRTTPAPQTPAPHADSSPAATAAPAEARTAVEAPVQDHAASDSAADANPTPAPAAPPDAPQPPSADAEPAAPPQAEPSTPPDVEPSTPDTGDWLNHLRQDLARCGQLSFFACIPCREKARWRYCNERWNTVPECATADRNS